ncbi:hypothetical protein QFC19_004581 [Naganishia cerealis]|uniref:Uncharacterized protein n=1 Tax=Naganishia cerealis TaxID=610337 RepID=A0ACC2VUI2_9TREE|nr:hypothetical protein QFC19_004581 [Naganishia cerealis]
MSTGITQSQQIISLLQASHIVPEVLPSVPGDLEGQLSLAYPTHTIIPGEHVPRVVSKDIPVVRFKPFQESSARPGDGKFSIMMIDPDLTHMNDRLSGQVRHWLQPGIVFSADQDEPSAGGEGWWVGKVTEKAVTEYLDAHRYVFLLLRETASSAPQATDFPSTQRTHAASFPKENENLADRMGFNAAEYVEKKGLKVVGVTWMFVAPDLESLVDNAKIGVATVLDKVMGK